MAQLGNIPLIANLLEVDTDDLYENAPCGYLSTLPNGTIIRVNQTFLEWTGYRRDALVGKKRFQELLPMAGRIFYDTHFGPLLLMQNYVKELAFEMLGSDGKRIPILLNSKLKRDECGTPLVIRTTLLDARGRRAYEEELRLAKRRAEEAESTLRQLNATLEERVTERTIERDRIWSMSQDMLVVATIQGYFVSCNPAFFHIMGWSQQEMQTFPFTELAHPEQSQEMFDFIAKLAAGQSISRHKIRMRHKDGSYRWISWTVTPHGELLYAIGRDVTEDKKQAEILRETEEALRQAQKMEAIGQLTGGIAHDFNNLLAGIAGNLQLIRMRHDQNLSPDISRYVDSAESIVKRAAALTHRLLAFSRRQTLDPKPTNINQLVLSMAELIERTVGPSIQIHTECADHIWNILCDANQLENALLNLAINARDAMPNGGNLLIRTNNTVFTTATGCPKGTPPGNYVTISFTDTGIGMTPEVAARAFEPFFTTKPSGQGTGLGLSMIFGFIKQSGGHIDLQSKPGYGTSIKLHLPMYTGPVEEENTVSDPGDALLCTTQKTILLVDDEASLRVLLAELLEGVGYTVIQAQEAAQALDILRGSQTIDLLVTDVGLHGQMNGRQLADAARKHLPNLKIMFITGYAEHSVFGNSMLSSGMQVMIKPFELKEFAEKVSKAIKAQS